MAELRRVESWMTVAPSLRSAALSMNNYPFIFQLWTKWFDFFFLNWNFLVALTVFATVVRALLPQRSDAINSRFSNPSGYTPSQLQGSVWYLRDAWCQCQILIIELSVALRWLAGRSSVIKNRTKLIASGHETLTSYLISLASSTLFFAAAGVGGTALIAPFLLLDYSFHGKTALSFFALEADTGADDDPNQARRIRSYGAFDMCIFSVHFFLALGTSAEHLSRREVLDEEFMLKAERMFNQRYNSHGRMGLVAWFRFRRIISFLMQLLWVILFNIPKSSSVIVAIRYLSSTCVLTLFAVHAQSARVASKFLFETVDRESDSVLQVYFRGGSFLLKWHTKCDFYGGEDTASESILGKCRRVIAILLWHVSGRTFAAQVAMFITLCNWLNLVPAVQIVFSSFIIVATYASLLVWRLMIFMNPACINENGEEIPVEHIGFGMLAVKEQIMGLSSSSPDGNFLKLVPASVERIMEAFTMSYRWDTSVTMQMSIWNTSKPRTAFLDLEFLRNSFKHMSLFGPKYGHTLIWLDQVAIDQESNAFKAILVPKMTVCYALSTATVVLDNSYKHPHSEVHNYFRRIWTFQEYCMPPRLIVITLSRINAGQRPRQDSWNADLSRKQVQDKFWGSIDPKEFMVPWIDGGEVIERTIRNNPEVLSEYFDATLYRVGFRSFDRFPALMQTISGVICFTQEDITNLKRTIVHVMGAVPDIFGCVALIDNTGLDVTQPGSADANRLLAGHPCEGDAGALSSSELVLHHVMGYRVDMPSWSKCTFFMLRCEFAPLQNVPPIPVTVWIALVPNSESPDKMNSILHRMEFGYNNQKESRKLSDIAKYFLDRLEYFELESTLEQCFPDNVDEWVQVDEKVLSFSVF
mmetsp:Transcript_37629/g.93556  ORF Transcript_37629/g.93556 Transcript_37629/m.93556 type:complete len:868 (-) Transcript_37629:133-2736(-)|eukprot:CAMPEP_0181349670 /NCGR_PEP_ID=MMETSP1106-20121128/851_1 /TAXON_ID=81844 /ORGANISM="Mantoniella antarctica, Strain SL-175" /LENGTH=867 /DNA_ID=CAMNT_0023462081 /DNA_START=277 /DNA_END=2880 /DNA_ORIENTATION=-